MSARPLKKATKEAIILPFLTAGTVRQGMPVKMSGTSVVEATAITDNVIGIAYEQQTNVPQGAAIAGQGWSAPNGAKISVWLLGYGVCPVRVGTGGATVGLAMRPAAAGDGGTDATIGGGSGKIMILGTTLETGVAGDLVGVNLGTAGYSVGT